MTKNIDFVDLVKFLLAFMVVAIHTSFLNDAVYPMVRLAVPIFIVLAGFFAFAKIDSAKNLAEKKRYTKHIVVRYLKLYFFWFIVLLPYTLHYRQYFKDGILNGVFVMVRQFFFGSTFSASWFLMACTIGIGIISLLSRRLSNTMLVLVTLPFYLIATALSVFQGLIPMFPRLEAAYHGYTHYFGVPCRTFWLALLYLVMGKIIYDKLPHLKKVGAYRLGFVIAFGTLLLEYRLFSRFDFFIFNGDCLFFLAPAAGLLVLSVITVRVRIKGAQAMRKMSTIIYCVHMPFSTLWRKVLPMLEITDQNNVLLFLLTAGSAVACALLILQLEKHQNLKFLKYAH